MMNAPIPLGLWLALSCLLCLSEPSRTCVAGDRAPHVLLIAVDDLNDWVGCLGGHPQAKTPHIDRLAARGTVFLNAHCQAPLCNPSRASLLTGRRPSTLGLYTLIPSIRDLPEAQAIVTLPEHFKQHGYHTSTFGKVHHDGSVPPEWRAIEFDVWGPAPGMPRPTERFSQGPWNHPAMDWGIFPSDDTQQADWKIADAAIAQLRSQPADRPFFLCVGFRLPHVPCFASQPWFDLYPLSELQLPIVRDDDRTDIPDFAWNLHWKLPEPRLSALKAHAEWEPLVQAYLATTSFVDSQIGRVLAALDEAKLTERTLVVLWSDHGWHLGEKGITGKNSLWEESTRVPLIFAGPGVTPGGRCLQPVELLDIAPTLAQLCWLPFDPSWEGESLQRQLRDADASRARPAITTHNQGNYGVRSVRYRYIRYADGSEELYDHQTDPHEWTNLASRPEMSEVIAEHRRWLPQVDRPAVAGSAHRLLERRDDGWYWEGERIDPAAVER
jgi:choline-sulfatase